MVMALLEVSHLNKVYTTRFGASQVEALKDISFSVENGNSSDAQFFKNTK